MVFQFHQCIFHEIQKNFQPIRLPCKGDRIHSSHRPYRCHCVHSGRVSFHGDKCQTFRQCVDVSWIMNDRGFYSDSNVAKRTHAKQTFANLVQISWICSRFVSQRFYDRLVLEIWLHARPFCVQKFIPKQCFEMVFLIEIGINTQVSAHFCAHEWKQIRLSEVSSDCKNENRWHLIKGAPLQNLQPPGTKALQHDDTVGKADAWHPKARREHQNGSLDFRRQCIQSLIFSKFRFSSNTNRNETERFSAQVASGEELLRANYLPAGYPNS